MKTSKFITPTRIIKAGLFEGKNSVQIFLDVKDRFPDYDDRLLRKLISVVKAKFIKT